MDAVGGNGNTNGTTNTGGTISTGGVSPISAGGYTTSNNAGAMSAGGRPGTVGAMSVPTGGRAGLGGSTGTAGIQFYVIGGALATASGGSTPVGGIAIPNQFYAQGDFEGSIWSVSDPDGSTLAIASNELCATGNLIKVPNIEGGTGPDYGGAWGALIGWDLNQLVDLDGGTNGYQTPVDLSAMHSITVGLTGATALTLRIQLNVDAADAGTTAYYCAAIPASGATIRLSDLRTQCWDPTSVGFFDKATMKPSSLAIQLVTDTASAHPFKFCVTALSLQ
jgi:hypothetical protein